MIKSEFYKIRKSIKVKITYLMIMVIAICQAIDSIIYAEFCVEQGGDYLNPMFMSLLSNNNTFSYIRVFLWPMPIFIILSYTSNYYIEKKNGLANIYYTRVARRRYYFNKIFVAFVHSFLLAMIPLVINLIINNIFIEHYDGSYYYYALETYTIEEMGEYCYYSIRHPFVAYAAYMFSASFIVGMLGILCQSVCMILKDNKLSYIVTFAIWMLYFSTVKYGVNDAMIPFGFGTSVLSQVLSVLNFVPPVVIGLIVSYIICVVKKDEI